MLTSDKIFGVIQMRYRDLRAATIALGDVRSMDTATPEMIDAAYRAVQAIEDHIKQLKDDFIGALDTEEATFALSEAARSSTAAQPETYVERVMRLAQKGIDEGCKIVHEDRISSYVTSSRNPQKAYWVGVDIQRSLVECECDGFQKGKHRMCKHLAMVLVHRGIVNETGIAA